MVKVVLQAFSFPFCCQWAGVVTVYSHLPFHFTKHTKTSVSEEVSKVRINDYTPHYSRNVLSYPCPKYQLLAPKSLYMSTCDTNTQTHTHRYKDIYAGFVDNLRMPLYIMNILIKWMLGGWGWGDRRQLTYAFIYYEYLNQVNVGGVGGGGGGGVGGWGGGEDKQIFHEHVLNKQVCNGWNQLYCYVRRANI